MTSTATTSTDALADAPAAHRQPSQGARSRPPDLARCQRHPALRLGRDARRQRRRRLRRVPGAGVDSAVPPGALPGRARRARRGDLPAALQQGKVLSAVYRVGPYQRPPARRRAMRCACWSNRSGRGAATQPRRRAGRSVDWRLANSGTHDRARRFRQYRARPSHSMLEAAPPRGYDVELRLGHLPPQLAPQPLGEARAALLVGPRLRQRLAHPAPPIVSRFSSSVCRCGRTLRHRAEVRQEQRRRRPRLDRGRRSPATARDRCRAAASAAARSRRRCRRRPCRRRRRRRSTRSK